MDPTPEYLTARLTEILISLRADAERATLRHKNELLALQEVIDGKDREISELQEEVHGYRKAAVGKTETASFKKITLGRKTPKNVSQFTSDLPTSSPQITRSVLLDQKATHNNQSAKNISHPHPQLKMENCQSVKLAKEASNARPAKNSLTEKQNMKIIRKKPSIPNFHSKNDRTASTISTTPLSKPKLSSSIKPSQRSQKRGESKQSKTSREKRCIDIMIPSVNFSSYSITAKGRQG